MLEMLFFHQKTSGHMWLVAYQAKNSYLKLVYRVIIDLRFHSTSKPHKTNNNPVHQTKLLKITLVPLSYQSQELTPPEEESMESTSTPSFDRPNKVDTFAL
jgi:hypothetical protein